MKIAIAAASFVLAATGAANAQTVASPTMSGPGQVALVENGRLLGPGVTASRRDTPESVAAQYRAVCASRDAYDKRRCARATRLIRAAQVKALESRGAGMSPPE